MGAEKHGRFSTCWKTYVLGESSRSLSRNIRPGLQPLRQRNIIIPSTVMSLPCPPRSPAIATLRWELDAWKRTLPAMSTQVSSHCDNGFQDLGVNATIHLPCPPRSPAIATAVPFVIMQ